MWCSENFPSLDTGDKEVPHKDLRVQRGSAVRHLPTLLLQTRLRIQNTRVRAGSKSFSVFLVMQLVTYMII